MTASSPDLQTLNFDSIAIGSESGAIADTDIAIVGMAGKFPGANTIDEFWLNLAAGQESIQILSDQALEKAGVPHSLLKNPRYVKAAGLIDGADQFDATFFGFSPKEAQLIDPQHRLLLEQAWTALEYGGYNPQTYGGSIGVYVGVGLNTYLLQSLYPHLLSGADLDSYQVQIRNDKDFLPTLISYKLNLRGPSFAIQTACSTSLVAVHVASQALINGECEMALAGGVTVHANPTGYLYQEGMILSPDGHCRAFDAQAQGTVGGNGVGVVLLKRLADAIADQDTIHGVIKGSAINNDGSAKVGYTAPSVEGQAAVITEAQAIAGTPSETISYVETHGTGTALGDPIEITALTQAFRQTASQPPLTPKSCAIGSVKTNIGHLDTAAGVAGLIKVVLALKHRMLPPSLNFETPNPTIPFSNSPFFVNTELSPWEPPSLPRRAGVSSFGIGGTNAHVILEEAPPWPQSERQPMRPGQLLILSAQSQDALKQQRQNLAAYLSSHPDIHLPDVAMTLARGRQAFAHRWMGFASSSQTAVDCLRAETNPGHEVKGDRPSMVFLFPGQGAQVLGMGQDLYAHEPIFRESINRCAEILQPLLSLDIQQFFGSGRIDPHLGNESFDLNQTQWAQPLLFAVEYALAQQWMNWGIIPEAMVGHSLGEYVAACVAGVFTLEDGLTLVAKRAQMMQTMPTGAMLAIAEPESTVQSWLNDEISLASSNGAVCTVSGSKEAIAALHATLTAQGLNATPLVTSHAFHSPAMDGMVTEFQKLLAKIPFQPPQIPYFSNVTGTWIEDQEVCQPSYWIQHLRQTVHFGEALTTLLADPNWVFLEVGPQRILTGLVRRHPAYQGQGLINSLTQVKQPDQPESIAILQALGQLWLQGCQPKWKRLYAREDSRRIPLPTYPFEPQRHWLEPPSQGFNPMFGLGRNPDVSQWFYVPTWKQLPPLLPAPAAPQCWLILLDELGLGVALAQTLRSQEHTVITVGYGDRRWLSEGDYQVDPAAPDSFLTLWGLLQAQSLIPQQILHLWTLQAQDLKVFHQSALEDHLDRGLYTLLGLVQSLGKIGHRDPIQLTVITQGGFNVLGNESRNPLHSLLLGAIKVIPQEYRNLTCRYLDLESGAPRRIRHPDLVQALIQDLTTPEQPLEMAHRGQSRWVPHYESVSLPEPSVSKLKSNGVYLITGGFGGIGFSIAEYLAQTFNAKLILVTRAELPPRNDWTQWCLDHPESDPIYQKIQQIQALENLGGRVWTRIADVSDFEAMQRLISQAEVDLGAINGLFHCAGVADFGGIIQGRDRAVTDQILASKLMGTLVLDTLFRDRTLDIWMVSSSLSTVLYKTLFGQVGYSVANEFLSAFSDYQRSHGQPESFAVHWTEWEEVGMAVNSRIQRNATKAKEEADQDWLVALNPTEGIEALSRLLHQQSSSVFVTPQDLTHLVQLQTQWNPDDLLDSLLEAESNQPKKSREGIHTAYIAPQTQLQRVLVELWEQALGIAPLGLQDNFYELGGDSLMSLGLLHRMEQKLSLSIPMTLLLDHPILGDLSQYLEAEYPEAIAPWLTPLDPELEPSPACDTLAADRFPDTQPTPQSPQILPIDHLPSPLVVQLQPGKSHAAPLFMIHPIGGGVDSYATLGRYLNSDWPLYGVRALGLDAEVDPCTNIPQMAACYLKKIISIQPQGPYYLGGWSMGGVVAYEMAQQLLQQGEVIGSLILIDSPAPSQSGRPTPWEIDFDLFTRGLGLTLPSPLVPDPSIPGDDLNCLQSLLIAGHDQGALPRMLELDTLKQLYQVFSAHRMGLINYEAEICLTSFPTLFFEAKVSHPKRGARFPNWGRSKTITAWQSLLPEEITHYVLPCDHFDLLKEPFIVQLASDLNQFLYHRMDSPKMAIASSHTGESL